MEILDQCRHLDPQKYRKVYVCADSDTTSASHIYIQPPQQDDASSAPPLHRIPRARHVGQSYPSSLLSTLHSFRYCLSLIFCSHIDVLICNGPGTCVPLVAAVLLRRVLMNTTTTNHHTTIMFIESACRVETLSWTGRLLYPWADVFLVHWPTLHLRYPQSTLASSLVKNEPTATSTTAATVLLIIKREKSHSPPQ